MILKKPYAFLIKYFKLIHIILSALIGYIISSFSNITDFFVFYTKSDFSYTITSVSQYINPLIYLALLIVIIFSLAMFILMRRKKKPTLFYIITFIYYLILIIAVLIASNAIKSLVEASLSQQTTRVFRDIYLIISIPQYYFIVMSIIRGIGFDVKKFNFNKDLQELEIKSEDDEEFEFIIGKDSYIYKRKVRRFVRELKYYILENKLIISIISGVIFIPVIIYLIINLNFIDKILGNIGNVDNFTIDLKEAYETQYDYNGDLVNKDKKYIILNMTITNKSNSPQKFKETSFFLKRGKNIYYNKPSLRNYFIDIGKAYTNENITSQATKNLIFVFEVKNKKSFNKYYLNILKEITYKDNQEVYNYSKLKIKPLVINESPKRVVRQEKEVIRLGKNLFNDSNIILSNIEIIPSYEYTYELCKNNICKEYIDVIKPQDSINQNLLIITYKLNLAKEIGINETVKNNSDFFDKFLKVEYTLNNKNIIKSFASRTYNNIENKVFIDLPKVITDKSDLNIMINTRNSHHFIKFES
ncbi:MAG: hypothetical protein PHD03_00975 [Bacilli bacterium]|nr:hypothetical protein [Bacilli bacterium]MDD4406576.1 hypothetical protein [Bacilli bacterium]